MLYNYTSMRKEERFDKRLAYYKKGLNRFVVKYISPGQKVLDVGCAEGKLGQYLKEYKKCIVTGIDISPRAIKEARKKLDKAYLVDVEKNKLSLALHSFDVIICADILEHLYDPAEVIKKLKPYLGKGGYFIFSIPNIANIRIRWNLLWGTFNYQKEGILYESHLHFFTKKTVLALVGGTGLRVVALDYSPGFSFFFLQGRILKLSLFEKLLNFLTKLAPTLFCRQFIIVAQS